jgi:transglutaminase-like putative cysteine protease
MNKKPSLHSIIILVCVALFCLSAGVKLLLLDYRPDQVIPLEGWRITIVQYGTGPGKDISFTNFLPPVEPGQLIESEKFNGDFDKYATGLRGINRSVTYSFHQPPGRVQASCSFVAIPQEIIFVLPDSFSVLAESATLQEQYLQSDTLIQKDAPEIAEKARELGITQMKNGMQIIRAVFDYCHDTIQNAKFSGETDAVLACRLGEASCNGKSRLMVALCRNAGIPARLVGGIILQGKDKKTTHQWVEVIINGKWVVFCPLNGHFGMKPENYLTFYRGDYAFFKHTKNIKYDYSFKLESILIPRDRSFKGPRFLDITSIWQLLEESGISLATLGVILVIPIGALVTIIFRNVAGVQTFGTFLPALIAYAFLGTGLWWGMLIFVTIIAGGAMVDFFVSKLKLLHTPRLTVIMIYVVTILLAYVVWGIRHGNTVLAHSLFFPLAIHTITIERFFVIAQERGIKKSFVVLGWTLIAVAFCYMVMSSLALQMIVVFFPETYLLVLAAAIYIGRWTGLRIGEVYRFRKLIFERREANHVV